MGRKLFHGFYIEGRHKQRKAYQSARLLYYYSIEVLIKWRKDEKIE